ncbi:nitrate regulatory gene2 protein-like isoform X1 [Juglans microcarpa x Juglans regia]|uniref:nitrate regulatory gene2 protein-like isoform X1 n=1 Tax=Juglans microcarpa x Juglans regia TaxID=2249226 RepID=UPI001B7E387C|nr:nitrate regulatory gene2 protein-like isoform X1 [Juglans microcarpa x Juglans regia]
MGCGASKLDDLPAVALCRDRCNFLEEALRLSYSLADAHVAYLQSLNTLGPTLHRFFTQITEHSDSDPVPQPTKSSPPHCISLSSSKSDSKANSHLEFRSDSEADDAEKEIDYFSGIHHDFLSHHQSLAPSPPPASNSAWDFLNFFDAYDRYEPLFNHKEEVPDFEPEPVKTKTEEHVKSNEDVPNLSAENKVVSEKDRPETPTATRGVSEAMREIQVLFDKASDSGNEVLKLLEVGIFHYHHKVAVNQVASCKVLHAITPSLPRRSVEKFSPLIKKNTSSDHRDIMGLGSENISSVLEKLCMWEEKLYTEVKALEKFRAIHDKKCRELTLLNKKGAEASKVDSVQYLIRSLSTNMRISIQVIDRTAITINRMRDEELLQQINKLILVLVGMWKAMLDCHRCQCEAVEGGKILDCIKSNGKFNYADLEAAMELKFELQNWNLCFFNWIDIQKAHTKALNGWLLRCVHYEPEETLNGTVPFSPAKIGAPPVFVICNRWSQAMDKVSEKEVIEAMQGFFMTLNQLLEPHIADMQLRSAADKGVERKLKILDREEQRIQKMAQSREKKMVHVQPRREIVNSSSLLSGLKTIFGAMERFTANSVEAYEELCQRIQEDGHV